MSQDQPARFCVRCQKVKSRINRSVLPPSVCPENSWSWIPTPPSCHLARPWPFAAAFNKYPLRVGRFDAQWAMVVLDTRRFNHQLAAFQLTDDDRETLVESVELALATA